MKNMYNMYSSKGITLILSHVQEQPYHVMEKAGFVDEIGQENICANIDASLEHARIVNAR